MLRSGFLASFGALLASGLLVAGCQSGGIADDSLGAHSRAMSLGAPNAYATCSKADHDRYVVAGPDGTLYPTWHPAVDPVKGCSFGHEHGRDPHGSALYGAIGALPFGVAYEALGTGDSGPVLPEDHAAQKIEWRDGVMLQQEVDGERVDIGVRCDFLVKFHQANAGEPYDNPSELVYHVKCDDGTEIHATTLVRFDEPAVIATADGTRLAFYDPRFGLVSPPRMADPGSRNATQMLMDLCGAGNSSDGAHSARCEAFPTMEARRQVYFNQTGVYNGGGPAVWYTDPFGANASVTRFPGSIRQLISPVTNDRGFALTGQQFEGGTESPR